MNTLLSLGVAMTIGLLMTRVIKLIKLPNVTAFLVGGLLIGPSFWTLVTGGKFAGIITAETVENFDIIVTVALGFIAFSIGGEFRLSEVKKLGKQILVITVLQALCAAGFVFVAELAFGFEFSEALVLGAIATATAPAATLLVVRQYKAFLVIIPSLLVGAVFGLLVAIGVKFFKSRANRLSLCIAAVIIDVGLVELFETLKPAVFGVELSLSSLLVCMMTGAVFCNLCGEYAKVLEGTDRWTPPLFMLFFVISGADLNISLLPKLGLIGVVYLFARALGKYFGARIGATIAKADKNIRKYLGLTLLPQAGVAIGMAQMVISELPQYGADIQAVVLCATLIYEIIGPIATKIALVKAGEIRKDA